jgi:hypothetical protein
VQWHFSLQHEAIHSMRGIPKRLRRALVWPPIGIWFPFELYRSTIAIVISPFRGRIRNRTIMRRKTGRITAVCRDGSSSSTRRSWAACLLDRSCAYRTFLSRKSVK